MKFTQFFVLIAFASLFTFTSCQESCKRCSGTLEAKTFVDNELISTVESEVSPIEYCGESLEMLEANPVVEQELEQMVGNITQRIVSTTTYTCE